MRRRFAARAEIARRAHEARAEMMQPDAIDHDAGGEWIVFAGDGIGQVQSSAAMGERLPFFAREELEKLTWHLLAFVDRIAANEHARIPLRGSVFKNHRVRWRSGFDNPTVDLGLQFGQLDAPRFIEEPFQINHRTVRHEHRRIRRVKHLS